MFARQSLGNDIQVELWYLAEHFLLEWHDWHMLKDRFPRYFGEPEKPFPLSWQRLDGACAVLANQLLRQNELDQLVFHSWLPNGTVGNMQQGAQPTVRDVYQIVVQNYRRWSLLRDAVAGRLEPVADPGKESKPAGEVWAKCRQLVVELNEKTVASCQPLMDVLGRDLRFHLRHYCHANLLVSWLMNGADETDLSPRGDGRGDGSGAGYGDGTGDGRGDGSGTGLGDGTGDANGGVSDRVIRGRSALFHLLAERIPMPPMATFLSHFQDTELQATAGRVLERIVAAIAEIGYDAFVDDVTCSEFRGGPESLVGASAINLIPSQAHGPCHSVLLAVSRGEKKAGGFPSVMRQVKEHLIRCPATRAVIVVCDHWRPDEHIGDLRACHDRGVRFMFLLVGIPGRVVAPVAVDLGLIP